ncbi:metallophosphoesterase [Virgibacillus sp. FSP13]
MIYLLFLVILLLLVFIMYMVYQAHHDTINYQTIHDTSLPIGFDNYRIFFISDIHRRIIRDDTLQSITEKMDIVIIGGDLTEKGVPLERTRTNIKKLKRWNAPIYFVWGNNDYEADPPAIAKLLSEEGVIILANTHTDITAENGDMLSILGLDCSYYREARMDLAMEHANGDFYILATHAPRTFYDLEAEEQQKANLVLAGHTHGGQIRIAGFGPYQRGGLQKHHHSNVIVSEGYGYTRLPFRLGTNAECHVLTLKKQTK